MRRMIRGRLYTTIKMGMEKGAQAFDIMEGPVRDVGFRLVAEGGYRLFRGSYSGMRVKSASAVMNYHEWKSFTHRCLGFRVVYGPET